MSFDCKIQNFTIINQNNLGKIVRADYTDKKEKKEDFGKSSPFWIIPTGKRDSKEKKLTI